MSDNGRPDLVRRAICGGAIELGLGQILWYDPCWKRFRGDSQIPEEHRTSKAFKLLLREHVCNNNGDIEFRLETDEFWLDKYRDPWNYWVVIPAREVSGGIYTKMKLIWEEDDSPDDAAVELVSVHRGFDH